jgi:acyl carrier protein
MSTSSLAVTAICTLVVCVLVILSALWRRFHPPKPRGVRFSPKAVQWAESRFPTELRPVASYVADLLRDQLGVGFAQLEPHTRFIEDLGMDDMEPVEVLMALEEDLGFGIGAEDAERLLTISELVDYIHHRLHLLNNVV